MAGSLPMTGCSTDPSQGYSFSPAFRQDVQTIAVPIFQNDTFYPRMAGKLNESIVAEIRKQTPYAIVDRAQSQTLLTGTIRTVNLSTLFTDQQTGLAAESAVSMTVDFAWTDTRSGRVLMSRKNFSVARAFVPARQGGELIQTGEDQAVQQLAKDIVAEMRSGW